MKKICFVGDIACDRLLLKATKRSQYCFDGVLKNMKPFFEKADYVVGNLETIFAAPYRKYNDDIRYNTPDSFLDEIAYSGINMLTTANNHCFDCEIQGVDRTLDLLDSKGINHTGTFRDGEQADYDLVEIGGIKIAFLAYTYGINTYYDSDIPEDLRDHVNTLRVHNAGQKKENFIRILLHKLAIRAHIKVMLGIPTIDPCKDVFYDGIINESIMNEVAIKIQKAKEASDITVFCLHAGGQFNEEPGEYVEYLIRFLKNQGVDIVVGHHPHTIQKVNASDNQIFAYSLGGLVMSPSAPYVSRGCLPEYSIALNVYINEENKQIEKQSFSFIKITEDKNHFVSVCPVYDLYQKAAQKEKDVILNDIIVLTKRLTGEDTVESSLQEEYYF